MKLRRLADGSFKSVEEHSKMKPPIEKYQQTAPIKLGIRHLLSVLLFLFIAITYGMRSSFSVAIVAMTDNSSSSSNFTVYNWDSKTKSLMLSSLLWGALISQIPIGLLTKNGGSHKLCCISFIVTGVATVLIPTLVSVGGWIAVICVRVVIGLSQGCVSPCVYKIMSGWVPPQERARLVSFVINGAQLGTIVLLPISGVLAHSVLGWPSIFYISGAISVGWSVLFYFYGADTPAEHSKISLEELNYIESSLGKSNNVEQQDLKFPWRSIVKSVPVWAMIISNCAQAWCYYIFLNELPSYMTYILKFNIQESGLVSALPYLAMWLMGFPMGWLSDFGLSKGIPVTYVRKVCSTIAMWGPGVLLIVLAIIETDKKSIYVLLLALAMGLNSGVNAGSEIVAIDMTPAYSGTLVAFTNSAAKVCGTLSPIVCGLIVTDTTNVTQWQTVFYLTAGIYFVSNLIFLIFGSAKRQPWDYQDLSEVENTIKTPRMSTISSVY